MGTRLWLDDLRPAPPGWTHVKTVQEAEEHLLNNEVDEASLDHDLGHSPGCPACQPTADARSQHIDAPNGKHLVLWMIEHSKWPKNKPNIHSQNPVGRETMRALVDRYFPS